jgi:hypothetical protein
MGYLHIDNLYKNQTVLQFSTMYAMEKVHGTSAHIGWDGKEVRFFSGGATRDHFLALFNEDLLKNIFAGNKRLFGDHAVVYGEAYGGKMQAMSHVYGPDLKFIVFDVKVDGEWLSVLDAKNCAAVLGLEFVPFKLVSNKLEELDAERDAPSVVAMMRGMGDNKIREGVVLRPVAEFNDERGNRVIAKHKNQMFGETRTKREVNPDQLKVLAEAKAVATEWVTEERIRHAIDKACLEPLKPDITDIGSIIKWMVADIKREGDKEIAWGPKVEKEVGRAAAHLYKEMLNAEHDTRH